VDEVASAGNITNIPDVVRKYAAALWITNCSRLLTEVRSKLPGRCTIRGWNPCRGTYLVKVSRFGHIPHGCITALSNSQGFLLKRSFSQLCPVRTCLRGQLQGLQGGQCTVQVLHRTIIWHPVHVLSKKKLT